MSKLRTKGSNLELNALYRNKSTTTKPKTSFHLTLIEYRHVVTRNRGWEEEKSGGKLVGQKVQISSYNVNKY